MSARIGNDISLNLDVACSASRYIAIDMHRVASCTTRMKNESIHPGEYVRTNVIPVGTNVTTAAKLIDVSRPTLSNFLNGKADLSTEMAARLERAFGVSARTLLDVQSAWDAAKTTARSAAITKSYVPPFLQIKGADITRWATTGVTPRQRLAVFIRTLVNSTGVGLIKVEFPGNDDSERSGWDGEVTATQATPWVPSGHSGWEFGVTEDIKGKADPERRFEFDLGIDADDDPVDGIAVGLQAIRDLDFVLDAPAASAIIRDVGDSNIVLRFFGWVNQSRTDYLKGRSLALDAAKRSLEAHGFALPEPIYRLRFDQGAAVPTQSASNAPVAKPPKPAVSQHRIAHDAAPDAHIAKLVDEERAETQGGDLLDDKRPVE